MGAPGFKMPVMIVHHLNNSRSQRVLWLLEELEIPYEIKFYERDPQTLLAPPELRLIHPLGKSPVITDREICVAESGAIVEYVVGTYGQGRLRPKIGTAEDRRYTYWLHYAEGSLMSPLLLALVFGRIPKEPMPFFVKPIVAEVSKKVFAGFIKPQLDLHSKYLEEELGKTLWFAGPEFSAADIQMSFPIEALSERSGFGDQFPKLMGYLERIHARPAYQRAIKKGGPFQVMA